MAGRSARRSARGRLVRLLAPVVLGALAAAPPLAAAPAFLPAPAITVGMTGVGKTVILGTRVTEFRVRVLGILKNAGPAGDLVLFRAFGPAIQSVGGLAAGMSGSPIYLDGRLAGAFSYQLEAADPTTGLFTPIQDMLRDLPRAAGGRARAVAVRPFRLDGRAIRRIALAPAAVSATPAVPGTLVAVPAATPLFVSGLGVAEQTALARMLAPMDVIPIAGSASANLPASLPLVPGSAIGVALMRGDISAYAIGTLTYRDGARILALGHPFTDIGPAHYLLTNATIFQTVRGQQRNIKVGAAGAVVGTISEDRPAAIGGTIGILPRVFGVRVRVTDADAAVSRRFEFQVVTGKELAPALVTLGAQEAVERALNRSGAGTAQVRMIVNGRGLPHPIERDNVFYSGIDIAAGAVAEVPRAMLLVFDNDFAEVVPVDMQLDVRVTSGQETAAITDVKVPARTVAPGQALDVQVTLRPFRGSPTVEDVSLPVPADFADGPAMLVVRAGGTSPMPPASGQGAAPGEGAAAERPREVPRSLTGAVDAFEHGEKHTDVVVELLGGAPRPSAAGDAAAGLSPVSATATTPWVLSGRLEIPMLIGGGSH